MRIYDIISNKRDCKALSKEEIDFAINGYVNGSVADYQMAALLMAIYLNGMTKQETLDLTKAMIASGDTIDLAMIDGVKVSKHRTAVLDVQDLDYLSPIVASLGIKVAKMSGRGLGHTGGTLDKLESINGFNVGCEMSKNVC